MRACGRTSIQEDQTLAITLTLSTAPATAAREKYGTSMSLDLFGPSLGTETLPAVSNIAEIKTAVARFGAKVQTAHPEASFYVSVSLAKGSRKPNGYDAARRGNGLGQENFVRVTDGRTEPEMQAEVVSALPGQAGAGA